MRGYELPPVIVPIPLIATLRAKLAARWAPPAGAPVDGPKP